MLSRAVLVAVQLIVGWMATPRLLEALPPVGGLGIFAYAVLAGLVVWLVGLALSQVLRDTRQPSSATLMAAILIAVAGALLVSFRGSLPVELRGALRAFSDELYPLLGALVGYALKR
ncbi:MAG TPA: hypothetical protein VFR19_13865 [Hyphomicrobiaceae bacterium]|jgi:hypothetical protein|nr:hypothetical protein [Hyphomicrobiaceae bacterium]